MNSNEKPLLELYVKASGIDSRRIGACLFCQEFWMELYSLYQLGCVLVEVKAVNVNSEAFKRSFSGAQPPVMEEPKKGVIYSDNREIEGRIFHLSREFNVPLFEKDEKVEKAIQNFYRNFKVFLQAKASTLNNKGRGGTNHHIGPVEGLPAQTSAAQNKLIDQLAQIDQLLQSRKSRYLVGDSMTEYDCELMPRLHHMRIVGQNLLDFDIPNKFIYLWNYMLTTYRTAAFIESCPADQDIMHHYKEQLNLVTDQRETLQEATKTHTLPEELLKTIQRLNLQNSNNS